MVSIVAEKKGNAVFYYMRHKSGTNQLKRYLGKKIPKNIEQLKADFLLEFYQKQWNPNFESPFTKIIRSDAKSIPSTIKLHNS